MKNGLHTEDGTLIYYKHGRPYHAGAIKIDDKIYYIGKGGRAATGRHVVHGEMTNGLLRRGTYTFDENGVLVEGSFVAPRKKRRLKLFSRKRKRSKLHLSKKNRIRLWGAVAAMVVLTASVIGIAVMEAHHTPPVSSPTDNLVDGEIVLPMFDEDVLLCSEAAKDYYDGVIDISAALKGGSPYVPFKFEYDLGGRSGRLLLSESEDLSAAKEFALEEKSTSLTIDNLKTDTQYYYAVEVNGETYNGKFKTAKSNRFISIPGVLNTRDIGGYTNMDGKTVRQGLIIRGTETDGLVEHAYFLDPDAEEYVKEEFGFVYDMDLRNEGLFTGEYDSRIGDNVRHRFFSAPAYGPMFSMQYKQSVKDMFTTLADPNNYPMYLHCTHGADRTGTLIFLLQGVLNMSEEDMMKEYRLTSFFKPAYATIDYMDPVITGLQAYKGDTLQQKIEDYLVNDARVPKEDIEAIRSILLKP